MGEWWVHSVFNNLGPVALLAWIFWVLFSICLHELGHGWAAISQGDDTPIRTGHMTWNPVVHMGVWSLAMFAVIGIAWGLMPINPSRFKDGRKGEAIVAAAGPAMNLGLAVITFIGLVLWMRHAVSPYSQTQQTVPAWVEAGFHILRIGCGLNVILLLFNLLPVPPLDGSRILSAVSWQARELYERPQVQMYGMLVVLLLVLWFAGPIFGGIWTAVIDGAVHIAGMLP